MIMKFGVLKSKLSWWLTNSVMCWFPSSRFRIFYLRLLGVKINRDVVILEGFHIRNPKGITLEHGVNIGPKVLLDGRQGLHIGKSAVIAYEAIIWTLNHDYNDIHFCSKGAPVNIGEYAWVCSRSIILPGINIGKGAVVASNAVVTRDVPDFAIVAGVPAKIIGYREVKDYDY